MDGGVSVSIREVPMSITVGQWVKCPWQSVHATSCLLQVVCQSLSGVPVGGMPVECVGWNACGTETPMEHVGWNAHGTGIPVECVRWNVLGGVPMERAWWNACGMCRVGTCLVECPWNVLGGILMERVR